MVFEIILAGKLHSHVPPRASSGKETPFRSQIDYIKRPRANKHAKEIITLVIFRTLFA